MGIASVPIASQKRQCLEAGAWTTRYTDSTEFPLRHKQSNSAPSSAMIIAQPPLTMTSGGLSKSVAELEDASQAYRLVQLERDKAKKGTGTSYDRHVEHYVTFWDNYEDDLCLRDPTRTRLPAFPITAAKTAMFLQHESTREKVCIHVTGLWSLADYPQRKAGSKETIAGSNLGKSHISGVISALENYRVHHAYQHKDDPDAQTPLRNDARIKRFEKSAKQDEPKRVQQAQALKAVGTSSGTCVRESGSLIHD